MRHSVPPLVALGLLLAGLVVPPAAASPYVWQVERVDSRGVITQAALALDGEGDPHIAYYESSGRDLRYAHWNESAWLLEDVDTAGDVGGSPSITLDSSQRPHIVYMDVDRDFVVHAVREAGLWRREVVDTMGSIPSANLRWVGSAIGRVDDLHLCYRTTSGSLLKYAHLSSGTWVNESIAGGTSGYGQYCSIGLDSSGRPRISYSQSGALGYAAWNGTAWNIATVDSTDGVSCCTGIALNASGNPFIGYSTGGTPGGKLVRWDGATWEVLAPKTLGDDFLSLAFDSSDRLHSNDCTTYRFWSSGVWTNESLPHLFCGGGLGSLALHQDIPRIAYIDAAGDLYYARAYATPQAPGAPRSLAALGGNASVALTWTAPGWDGGSPITGYRVYRGTAPNPGPLVATLANLTAYTDTGVTNGQVYYYRVAAVNAIGEGPPSSEVSAIPSGPGDDPPTCAITSPSGGTVSGTVMIGGTALDPEGSLDRVEARVDAGSWTPANGTAFWTHVWNSSSVVDGTHSIEARAYDGNSYSAPCSVAVTTDNGVAPPPPDGDFLRDYGWVLALLVGVLAGAGIFVFALQRRRRPSEQEPRGSP